MSMEAGLRGIRCLLVNPFLHPVDLRGEIQTQNEDKHESGMNYGLLVVATVLQRAGADVHILDLEAPGDWRERLDSALDQSAPRILGVGSLSVYSFLPTLAVLRRARERIGPGLVTMVGGQNAQNFPLLLRRPEDRGLVDHLVCGDAEDAIVAIAAAVEAGREAAPFAGVTRPSQAQPFDGRFTAKVPLDARNSMLDYELYPGWRHLWPVIEESRGCPHKCDFCANVLQGGASIRFKSAELLLAETRRLFRIHGDPSELPVVLMTSIFGVNAKITAEYFTALRTTSMRPRFVASTRVDLNIAPYIDLIGPYFDQMHFGLETGSLPVVARMVKSASARHYLDRARIALASYHDHGIHTAANFIVGYLGETHDTVRETFAFLEANRDSLDSVWGGGLVAYPDSPFARDFAPYAERYGARLERVSPFCDALSTYPVSPSADLSYEDVQRYTSEVHALFFDEERFYHHYKWYVGPDRSQPAPSFFGAEAFYARFGRPSLFAG